MLNGLPPNNPALAWTVVVASVLIACAPLLVSRMRDRAAKPEPVVASTTQAQLDVGQGLLQVMFKKLEERAEIAERKAEDSIEKNADLRARLSAAEERIDHLTSEVRVLTAQLMERNRGS